MSETRPSTDADESDEPLPRGLDLYWSPPRIIEEERDVRPTPYRAGVNQFELRCGVRGGVYYADEQTFDRIKSAGRAGQDNPFRCEACEW